MKTIVYTIAIVTFLGSCQNSVTTPVTADEKDTEVAVETITAPESNSNNMVSCTGIIEAAPESMVSLHAPISAYVQGIKLHVGQKVNKGQVLARMEHREIIQIQEDYLKAKADYYYYQDEYQPRKELFDNKVISRKEFREFEAAFLSKKAEFESLKKQIAYLGIDLKKLDSGSIQESIFLTAPISGYVVKVYRNNGAFVDENTGLFDLVDEQSKHLSLDVFADDAVKLRPGNSIDFVLAGSDKKYKGTIEFISKMVDPESKSVKIVARINEPGSELIIGTAVFADIAINKMP